jgi:hypothetical protein
MKTAVVFLLVIGLIVGLAVPYYVQNSVADAGIQWPGFPWSKSPPRTFNFSVPVFFRIMGGICVVLAVVRFVSIQNSSGK